MSDIHADTENAPVDERVLNPAEQRQRVQGFVTEARELQQLLKTYEQQQRSLEADVAAFVVQEIKEQQVMKELREEILRRERGCLQDMNYVRFTMDHQEGSIDFEETAPTQRMRTHNNSDGCEGASSGQAGSLACVTLTSLRASSDLAMASWCPDRVVDLRAYGDLKEVLLGWRAATTSSAGEMDALSRDVFAPLSDGTDSTTPLCCFANGVLCVPPTLLSEGGAPEASLTAAVEACTSTATTRAPCAADVAVRFFNWLHSTAVFSVRTLASAALAAVAVEDGATSTMLASGLTGDVHDTLAFVNPARLQDTQLFRVFVLRGELAAIEHIGAPVDVLPVLAMMDTTMTMDRRLLRQREQDRLTRTAAKLYAALCACTRQAASALPPNLVLTLAVSPEPLDVTTDDAAHTVHANGVLVDVCRLTPTMPFRWHLTWGEVCSLGQVRRAAATGAGETAVPTAVVFKCPTVQAALLEPYDAMSTAYFPLLNARVLGADTGATAPTAHGPRSATRADDIHTTGGVNPPAKESKDLSTLYACGAVLSVAALAAAATARVWSRKD